MNNVIFYFSGTGNNLAVASHIAKSLKDTEIIHVLKLEETLKNKSTYERIGFVFPVYYLHMPRVMKEIISKAQFKSDQYIFGVIAHGGSRGMAMGDLRKEINQQGGKLSGEFRVRMPGNYIVEYGAFPRAICNFLYKREERKILKISLKIKRKDPTDIMKPGIIAKLFHDNAIKQSSNFKMKDREFKVNDKCLHCKVCKNVCSVNNIDFPGDKPRWKNNCEQCMACIQWCPAKAIEYSNKTRKRKQYSHPEIKANDIIQGLSKNIETKVIE